jgi:glycosyltransferase involved in cell wall biosynthesis
MSGAARTVLLVNSERGWRGGEAQLVLLARGLAGSGWEPLVAAQPGSPLAERARQAGLAVEELAQGGALDLAGALRLRALARRCGAALVHAHTSKSHSLAALGLFGSGIPLVVSRKVVFAPGRGPVAAWKYRRAPAGWIAISQAVAEVLRRAGVEERRIAVIPDAIDPEPLDAAPAGVLRRELGLAPEALLVGCIAHFTPEKGHDTLLAAWAQVAEACPHAHLALVGDGPLRVACERAAPPRCHFLGARADIAAVHRSLDLCVLASRHEGLGSSLLDAQACGVPVVATRAGGIPEAVADGQTGWLVAVDDAPALTHALVRVLDDAGLRRTAGEAGCSRVRSRHGWVEVARQHARLYSLLAGVAAGK